MRRSPALFLCLASFGGACGARSSDPNVGKLGSSATDAGEQRPSSRGDAGARDGTETSDDGAVSEGTDEVASGGSVPPNAGTPSVPISPPDMTTLPGSTPAPLMPAPTTPSATGPAPIGVGETCPSGMDYPNLDNVEAGFDGVIGFAAWGDSVTTLCLRQEPGRICAYGVAGSSGDDYLLWGAGFSIALTPSLSEGRDLSALGILGVQVELSQVAGRDVRMMATQANDPDLGEGPNYADNAFVFGGTSPRGFDSDVMLSLSLGDFTLPAWTQLVDESGAPREGQTLDLRNVSTLQFMVINNPGDSIANYSFCVNDFTFIDASGEAVPLPNYVAPDAGVAEPEPEVDLPAEAGTDARLAVTLDAG